MSRAYCGNRAIAVLNIFLVVVLVIGMAKHFSFSLVMAALRSRCGHYIFARGFFLSFYLFTRLISAAAGWMPTIL